MWDFCCDHGYLGEAALLSGQFSSIHFVDQVPHIMQNLHSRLASHNFRGDRATTACYFYTVAGENLDKEVDGNIAITGVGADTIQKILMGLWKRNLLKADLLVLGPHRDASLLQSWLESQDWVYKLHTILTVEERGRARKLFIVKRVD